MRTDFYKMYQILHNEEMQELKRAVRSFGGKVRFGRGNTGDDASGTERPCIAVNVSNWDSGPEDVFIDSVSVDENYNMEILAETKEGIMFSLNPDDIEFGHVSFITDLIPDREYSRKIKKEQLVMETAVFMSRDMFEKMYNPENGNGQFEVCHEIIRLARVFENTRKWSVDDEDYDEHKYFEELTDFEDVYLKKIKS